MPTSNTHTSEIELLYRQYGPALLVFASAMTGERGRAQDAVHHVFLRLMENGNLGHAADKKAYLFACVRNAVLNETKRQQRNTDLDPESAWFDPPLRDYAAELNLRQALSSLPEDQREVIVLHMWGELTFAQIAALLDISSNTVASRYRYALTKLRYSMCPKEEPCGKSK